MCDAFYQNTGMLLNGHAINNTAFAVNGDAFCVLFINMSIQ
jgi:hypothetical protein